MDAKLTLKLDKEVIERAKEYASSHNKSLSRMVEAYLKSLTDRTGVQSGSETEISPFVKSLRSGVKIPSDVDAKEMYRDRLKEKYL